MVMQKKISVVRVNNIIERPSRSNCGELYHFCQGKHQRDKGAERDVHYHLKLQLKIQRNKYVPLKLPAIGTIGCFSLPGTILRHVV